MPTANTTAAHTRTFTIPDVGQVSATITEPDHQGTVVYELTGPRISGALGIAIGDPLRITEPDAATYTYGLATSRHNPHRLTVNGIALRGEHTISRQRLTESPASVVTNRHGPDGTEAAPAATARRARAVVTACLSDFWTREDLPALWHAAARPAAAIALPYAADQVARTADARSAAEQEYQRARRRLDVLERIADGQPPTEVHADLFDEL
ncbi:hypothetical protein OG225_43175 (plasmid) [Nocardia sp. NBC_01377]|uniref:hypothetical protein n=1 Tax=Nocardia sp. NBC_01377 TaxID=2903595 RepID=UPI002F918FAA